jgi:hypothetical protein
MLRNCGIDKKHYEVDYTHYDPLPLNQKVKFKNQINEQIKETIRAAKKDINYVSEIKED